MKKKILLTALVAFTVVSAGAQTEYDAVNLAQKDLNGTARFVGMGGAMGALGGDISTIGTNPAGIGIYRSNDAMVTFGYSTTGTQSDYVGNRFEMNKNRWNFDNAGFVLSTKIGNMTSLRFVNFGFNYHKSKSFYKNMTMQGMMGSIDGVHLSQARYMALQATSAQSYVHDRYNQALEWGSEGIYSDADAGWLGALGYNGWLIDEDTSVSPNSYWARVPSEADAYFLSKERGGIDQYDFNVAFNFNERFYFGITLGTYSVDYEKYSLHDERYENNTGYGLNSYSGIKGSGFDMKFGMIIRPFETSPLRIGLAVHTPIFYKLTYTNGALLQSDYLNDKDELVGVDIDMRDFLDGTDMDRDFQLQTPWVLNASLGYTVGSSLALGAEYEYENYSGMKFSYPDGEKMEWETAGVDLNLKGVHTLRLGAEWKPISAFALRAGYNYGSAAFNESALKELPSNSISTDTDFSNNKSSNTYTLGIGYRGSLFYADLAYKYNTYKSDFYPFFNDIDGPVTAQATKVTHTRSQVLLTLGVRF